MNVFKFGGASVNSGESIRNLKKIITPYSNNELIVVVSAMGKTTRKLEKLAFAYFDRQNTDYQFEEIRKFHFETLNGLFHNKEHKVYYEINAFFDQLKAVLSREPSLNLNYEYDQIVSFGELFSTTIISNFLHSQGVNNKWIDIRKILRTDNTYREAKVDWELTKNLMQKTFVFENNALYITQGFIGSTPNNLSTTLGIEGSDFTAAVIAFVMNAKSVTIWKDVEGVFNADPKLFQDAVLLSHISYKEAVELAYFGAKVIHPKTIKPLQNKNIPLFVKSFIRPETKGTMIRDTKTEIDLCPIFIYKHNQILISVSPKDFSFVAEENISKIFGLLAKYRIKANLMENSAISFSVCADNDNYKIKPFVETLKAEFKVRYNKNVELITIRHYNQEAIKKVISQKSIIVEQKNRLTARFVIM